LTFLSPKTAMSPGANFASYSELVLELVSFLERTYSHDFQERVAAAG
jgi:hypothetical protein